MHFIHYRCVCTLLITFGALEAQSGLPHFDLDRHSPDYSKMSNMSLPLAGELRLDETLTPSHFRIQLADTTRRDVLAEAHVSSLGQFELRSVPPGIYELRVVGMDGSVVHTTAVSLPYANTFVIQLSKPQPASIGRPISIARMKHKVPKKALREYNLGYAAAREDRVETATTHLEKALNLDPQFFEAANNLGALYLRQTRLSEAFEMFRRATSIDSSDPMAEANLAFVLLRLNRFGEAEEAARASVKSDGLSARARFFLAVSLLEQKKNRKEAIFHLTQAREGFEPAKKLLRILDLENPAPAK